MRIRLAIPDRIVSAPILDAALEATTRAAQAQQVRGEGPTFSDLLRSGVKWRPERFTDGEHFDLPSIVGQRGWGDCDDLAPALAAELRQVDPGARARVIKSGPERWHAIVQMSDGTLIDPSKMAGMKGRKGVVGAVTRPMAHSGESAISFTPYRGDWWARTDVPWNDAHVSSTYHDRDLERALDGSIHGAMCVGEGLGWEHAADRSVVGSIFDTVLNAAAGIIPGGSAALGLAKGMGILPGGGGGGGGAPAAAPGAPQGSAGTYSLPGGGRTKAVCSPGGPIIVRF